MWFPNYRVAARNFWVTLIIRKNIYRKKEEEEINFIAKSLHLLLCSASKKYVTELWSDSKITKYWLWETKYFDSLAELYVTVHVTPTRKIKVLSFLSNCNVELSVISRLLYSSVLTIQFHFDLFRSIVSWYIFITSSESLKGLRITCQCLSLYFQVVTIKLT